MNDQHQSWQITTQSTAAQDVAILLIWEKRQAKSLADTNF